MSSPYAKPSRALAFGLVLASCTVAPSVATIDADFSYDAGAADVLPADGSLDASQETCGEPLRASGESCAASTECDDGCFCDGIETCVEGVCRQGADPCADDIECTDVSCLEETNHCFVVPRDQRCSNGDACDGAETCDVRAGCQVATPLYCNDESSCTVDSCDPARGCVFVPRDLDHDGFLSGACGGDDCDDDPRYGSEVHPGAAEVCDNQSDDDCDGLRDYFDDSCVPTNDACQSAILIPARTGTYSGSTRGLRRDYVLGCTSSLSGADAVFRFTLSETHDVRASVGGSNSALAIRAWDRCAAGPELRCAAGSAPSVLVRSLPPGEYAVIVRTAAAPFELALDVSAPTAAPAFDTCTESTVAITASGTYSGRFEEVSDDYALPCHAGAYSDAAYRLELTETSDVRLSARITDGSFYSPAVVALTPSCTDSAAARGCTVGAPAELTARTLDPGIYFVVLEPSEAAIGWALDVAISPAAPRVPGDFCGNTIPITLVDGVGSASAALAGTVLDNGTSCGGTTSGYRDVFFSFDLNAPSDVEVNVSGPGYAYVGLEEQCGLIGSEQRCRSGPTPLLALWRTLPAGHHVLVVAVGTGSNVSVGLHVAPSTPIPENDLCAQAIDLRPLVSRRDTLSTFADDVRGCAFGALPDAFYTFTLASRTRVLFNASDPNGESSRRFYLTLRSGCESSSDLACANGSGTSSSTSLSRTLDPGTYTLIVESPVGDAGEFFLDYATFSP
jgi:Dictyostelium (slime mold) repeat